MISILYFNSPSALTALDLATATTAPVASVTSFEASLSSVNLKLDPPDVRCQLSTMMSHLSEPSLALTLEAMTSWAVLPAISWLATIISSNLPLPKTTLEYENCQLNLNH